MIGLVADIILVVHFVFILFVVGGQVMILAGAGAGWRWIRNFHFRLCHILAISLVAAMAWAGKLCPLTLLENTLRESSGQPGYTDSFIRHWVGGIIYWDAPSWVFTLVYTLFAMVVILSWILIRPENTRR